MRYYSYDEYDPEHPLADHTGGYIVKVSEEDIKKDYWPYWYEKMCKKFGQEEVDSKYTFEDCLDDWIVVNWAWKSNG